MSFIQNLFTSRDNNANGNSYVGQESRIWWNPDTNAFYYSDGNTAGGILITGGSSGNGLPGGAANTVQYNAGGSNFGGDPNFTFDSSTSTLTITNIVANTLTGGAGGANTQVQFNTNGNFTGNSNFTYNQSTRAMLMTGTATLGNVFPAANNVSNIGSATNRFNDIWLGSGNINLIDDTLNINQEINAINGNLVISGGNGLIFGQFAIYGNTISTINPTANINIGLAGSTGYVDIERPLAVNSTGGGAPAFRVEQNGTVAINSYGNIIANSAALLINATTSGNDQPRNFEGTLIQATAQDNTPARMSADAYGVDGSGQNAYASWAARVARGNVNAPSQTQAGDTMFRFTSQGWSNSGAYIGSIVRYNQVALENFATGKAGTRHNFAATPVGTATIKNIANIDGNGITFGNVATGGIANVGITFSDGSYQNTAYLSTSVVRSLTAGAGIALSGSTGNITIQSTGVLGVNGTTNQISVSNVGNILTLSLPQNFNTTANVQLYSLTVQDLVILGNISNVIPSVVGGNIIYVANTATNISGINDSGLVTGNVGNSAWAGILYNTTSNTWQMDIGNSLGITSEYVYANSVVANATVQAGNVYASPIVAPTLVFRGDLSLNDVIGVGIRNHFQGADASTAFIAAPNNGEGPASNYLIAGINSNVYANAQYAVAGASDGYLRVNGGNLVIGTETAGKVINFFTGGVNSTSYIRGTLSDTGLSMVGNVTANNMISTSAIIGSTVSAVGNITGGNLLAPAGILSVSGNILGQNVNTGIVSATGNIRGGNINTTGLISTTSNVQAGNINTAGLISASGNIITSANISAGNITTAIMSATGNITGPNITATILSVSTLMSVSGNIQGGNFLTDGLISTTGNVTSNYFIGNGSLLTGIAVARISNGTSQVNIPVASSNANITINGTSNVAVFATTGQYVTGLVSATGNVISGNLVGQNLTPTRVTFVGSGKEIDDDAEFTYNDTTNTLSVGNISATGNVTAAYFSGNGSGLTGTVGGSRYYGQFWDTTTQLNGGATTANPMTFNTSDAFNTGVSIAVGNTSHVVIANPGVYNLQFSAQFAKTDSGQDTVSVWLAKNGVNVPDSCTDIDLNNNNARSVAAWNWLVDSTVANTYYQILWSSSDTNMQILAEGTRINPSRPAIPSVILTVTQA
jgi:hypothetical protein